MKKVSILGSTGSIGTQALDVIRQCGEIEVIALSAGRNIDLLERQVREFRPGYAVAADDRDASLLRARLADLPVRVLTGMEGLVEIATLDEVDMVVTAIVGMIGIRPTIAAIRAGKDIALANKETLVTAGHLIMPLIEAGGVKLFPIDSEHSAIFQSLRGEKADQIERLWITASGGPFRGKKREDLVSVRREDALRHPNWSMGQKITIDSATLVNKGLEVMEARWLFGVDLDRIRVVIQPQSVIHSMVEFRDGAVMAELGTADMRVPIQYALYYPERNRLETERLDFCRLGSLDFQEPDGETFRGLPLALEAAARGGSMPTVFNASNEEAVALFLADRVGFLQIYDLIGECMSRHRLVETPSLDEILDAEREARARVREMALKER